MTTRWYVTASIPYVNAAPHLGHALEFVQADALVRWRRLRGDDVRSLWGTDDHAAKNAQAAQAAGEAVQAFVDRHAAGFAALREPLQLGYDDFIRTSRDPRHRPAVERLWAACAASGDLYRGHYEGLYCTGCERFYEPGELPGGRCPEHRVPPEPLVEENWFFRLSRYGDRVAKAIRDGELRVEPAHRRNEVLAFLAGDVRDISVTRPARRSHGWGIPVPGDPEQIIWVWFDALTNYVSALGYGTAGERYRTWWSGAGRRVHVIGKGILRFHAAYWPAFLLSAGEPLPTDILVHEYVTVDGTKISKSLGATTDPSELAGSFGPDALRWWLLRDVSSVGDTDFRTERLLERHDQDLANSLGNFVTRVRGLLERFGGWPDPDAPGSGDGGPVDQLERSIPAIDDAIERLDLRSATGALTQVVAASNAYVNEHRPWELLADPGRRDEAVPVLAELVRVCRRLAELLGPFLPDAADRLRRCLDAPHGATTAPPFPRIEERLRSTDPDERARLRAGRRVRP